MRWRRTEGDRGQETEGEAPASRGVQGSGFRVQGRQVRSQSLPRASTRLPLRRSPPPPPPQASQPPIPKPQLPRAHAGTRGVVTPPPDAVSEPAAGDLVPIDSASAAAATQPAHQPPKPGDTIDPLMLGPQPLPKPKIKRDEIAVVCYLCKTRMYAPIAKIGETIQCPDCHSLNEVKAPKGYVPKKIGPDARRRSRLRTGRVLSTGPPIGRSLRRRANMPSWPSSIRPSAPPAGASEAGHRRRRRDGGAQGVRHDDDDDDDVEINVAAPVERLEIKPEIKPLPPPDPEEDLYDGKYDDGLIGDHVDRSKPEAWKKAPLVIGILGFLFYTSTLPRLVLYILGLIFAVNVSTRRSIMA